MKKILTAMAIIGVASSFNSFAQSKETVTWYSSDFEPYSIHTGNYKDKGFNDFILKEFAKLLPQYNHKYEAVPTPRVLDALSNEPSSCSIQMLKNPEREKTIAFSSVPYAYRLPNILFTSKEKAAIFKPFLNSAGELKLEEALASGKFKVGVMASRFYGPLFAEGMKKYESAFVTVPNNNSTSPIYTLMQKMENQDDFQASPGYQVEVSYHLKNNKRNLSDFVVFNLAGDNFIPFYISCSKNESGKKILDSLVKALPDPHGPQSFVNTYYKEWLDADAIKYYDDKLKAMSKK